MQIFAKRQRFPHCSGQPM